MSDGGLVTEAKPPVKWNKVVNQFIKSEASLQYASLHQLVLSWILKPKNATIATVTSKDTNNASAANTNIFNRLCGIASPAH